jgi:hypothetical protein
MSKNTGITNSFEAMQAELEAAGFSCDEESGQWFLFSKQLWFGIQIETAYAYLLQQRELAALRELADEMIAYETPQDIEHEEDVVVITHFWNWFFGEKLPEVKRLRGKE